MEQKIEMGLLHNAKGTMLKKLHQICQNFLKFSSLTLFSLQKNKYYSVYQSYNLNFMLVFS